jgi:hypothetical protein
MFFLFNRQANEDQFYIPLILQGLGVGMLMTPTIVFVVSSVPVRLSSSAAGICLFVRCFGFFVSIALINFFELFGKSKHYNTFQDQLTRLNPIANETILNRSNYLISKGISTDVAEKLSHKLLIGRVNIQGQIRFAMDYYEMISILLMMTLLVIALFPYINKTIIHLRSDQPAPF